MRLGPPGADLGAWAQCRNRALNPLLPTAESASETKNQFADHIDLRTVSKSELLIPKTEVASSSGPTGSYGLLLRPELHIGCWQTAREHKMGVSGRSAGSLLPPAVGCLVGPCSPWERAKWPWGLKFDSVEKHY